MAIGKQPNFTQEELHELVGYNPESGQFSKNGKVIGSKTTKISRILIKGKQCHAGKLAWYYVNGEYPEEIIYINGDCSDNRISNLEPTTRLHKAFVNSGKRTSANGVIGVHEAGDGWWVASIRYDGENRKLLMTKDYDEAVKARRKAELEIHGETLKDVSIQDKNDNQDKKREKKWYTYFIEDVEYSSIREIAEFYGLDVYTVEYRLKSKNYDDWTRVEITDEELLKHLKSIKSTSVKCSVDGVVYNSINRVADNFGISSNEVRKRLLGTDYPDWKRL